MQSMISQSLIPKSMIPITQSMILEPTTTHETPKQVLQTEAAKEKEVANEEQPQRQEINRQQPSVALPTEAREDKTGQCRHHRGDPTYYDHRDRGVIR